MTVLRPEVDRVVFYRILGAVHDANIVLDRHASVVAEAVARDRVGVDSRKAVGNDGVVVDDVMVRGAVAVAEDGVVVDGVVVDGVDDDEDDDISCSVGDAGDGDDDELHAAVACIRDDEHVDEEVGDGDILWGEVASWAQVEQPLRDVVASVEDQSMVWTSWGTLPNGVSSGACSICQFIRCNIGSCWQNIQPSRVFSSVASSRALQESVYSWRISDGINAPMSQVWVGNIAGKHSSMLLSHGRWCFGFLVKGSGYLSVVIVVGQFGGIKEMRGKISGVMTVVSLWDCANARRLPSAKGTVARFVAFIVHYNISILSCLKSVHIGSSTDHDGWLIIRDDSIVGRRNISSIMWRWHDTVDALW
jgi:hypothetical protein